jgi:hypothetical protein
MSLTAVEVDSPAGQDSGQPFLSSSGDAVVMSWLGRSEDGGRSLRFATYSGTGWSASRVIVEGVPFLVNVADFPSMTVAGDGTLWSHWLERDSEGFGYGVRVSRSDDGGASWAPSWVPHEDRSAAEHGFVSLLPVGRELGVVWLDGRGFAEGPGGGAPPLETALYFRVGDGLGSASGEVTLDGRVCDCCQTDVAQTSEGAILVYRDRGPAEIRDIRSMRFDGNSWTDGGLVHEDGWETGACPVNGPAVAAEGRRVVVAWFTAARGAPRVYVGFSDDGGRAFDAPVRVDEGAPAGRVDVAMLTDGTALVSWVERTGGDGAEVWLRRVGPRGEVLESLRATASASERVVGFPRLAKAGDDAIMLAWTDGTELLPRVRLTRIDLEAS